MGSRVSRQLAAASMLLALLGIGTGLARASTGVCDSNPPTTSNACIAQIQASGGVVNDIFRDKNGRTAQQLPLFGKVINVYPTCPTMNCAGCNPGTSNPPYDCPGQYSCVAGQCTLATVSDGVNALDRKWGHPCRLADQTLDVNGCFKMQGNCIPDGTGGNYFPWQSLIFDLGGPSNQVAIFAENDHGPQPCESLEYTVFLTNNPQSKELILQPTTTGADPNKWNRAVLKKIFTKGFVEIRPPDPGNPAHLACGDTALYSVEEDSMAQVFQLPCGINFRYASVVAGNDGLDFPACAYDSSEAELDAVAGLTEDGAAVCPDRDKDGYVDCNCVGAPPVCDCDDNDPNTHPGAPEACDAPKDYNCNKILPEPCPVGLTCYQSLCVPECRTEFPCPQGSTCVTNDAGKRLCAPSDCTVGGCPPGSTCDPATKKCRANCDNVVCPQGQHCVSGECVDPCRTAQCTSGFTCVDGVCQPPCNCFAGDVGCAGGNKCDRAQDAGSGTNLCVPPSCIGTTCAPGKHCEGDAGCVDFCNGVKCPPNEVCVPPAAGDAGAGAYGCVNLCSGVTCPADNKCDPSTGKCKPNPVSNDGGFTLPDAGAGSDATAGGDSGGDGGSNFATPGDPSGCACAALGSRSDGEAPTFLGLLAALGLAGAFMARRSR